MKFFTEMINLIALIVYCICAALFYSGCSAAKDGGIAGVTQVGNPTAKSAISGVVYNYSNNGNLAPLGGAVIVSQNGDTIGITDSNGNYSGAIVKTGDTDILKVLLDGYTLQTIKINKNSDTIVCNFKLQEIGNAPLIFNSNGIYAPRKSKSGRNNTAKYAAAGQQTIAVSSDGLIKITPQTGWSASGTDAGILMSAYNEIVNINNLQSFNEKFITDKNKLPEIVSGGQIEIRQKLDGCFAADRLKNSDINWLGNIDLLCGKALSKNLSDWKNYLNDSNKNLYLYYLDDNGNWQYKTTARIIEINGIFYCAPDTGNFLDGFYDFVFATERDLKITVSGTVKDKATDLPIANVEVIVHGLAIPVLTDVSGYYSTEMDMPFRSASIIMNFIKGGYIYENALVNLDLSNNITDYSHNQKLTATQSGAHISGIVYDTITSQPLANARITLESKTVFNSIGYNSNRKYLYAGWKPNVVYSFYYKNTETGSSGLIKSGFENGVTDTEIINILQSDGHKKGAFYISLSAVHSGFTESDTIAKFDLYLEYISSNSIGGIKSVNIFGGEDRGYFYGQYPETTVITGETWSVSVLWGDSVGVDHLIIPKKYFTGNILPLSQMKAWINANMDTLNMAAPGANDLSYLEDVSTVRIDYNISQTGDGDTENFIMFNLNADSAPKISGIQIMQPTAQIAEWSVFSDSVGLFRFENISVAYNGRLSIFSEKYGYLKSTVENIAPLNVGAAININIGIREFYSGATPDAPQNVFAAIDGDSIIISWKASTGADSYLIYYDNISPANEPFANLIIIPAINQFAVISDYNKSLKYYFKIKAFSNTGGYSDYSKLIER